MREGGMGRRKEGMSTHTYIYCRSLLSLVLVDYFLGGGGAMTMAKAENNSSKFNIFLKLKSFIS